MAYRIDGTVTDDSKIYIINTSNDTIEAVKSVSAGTYFVNYLDEESVHVLAVRTSDNKALAYGGVNAIYEAVDYSDTFLVATSLDDGCNASGDTWAEADSRLSFGYQTDRYVATRFTNVSIPQGAQIQVANVKLYHYASENLQTIYIKAVNENNSPQRYLDSPWGLTSSWDALPYTSQVSDTIPAYKSAGTLWTSTSLVNIIQTIVNRTGWSANNALTIVYKVTQNRGYTTHMYSRDGAGATYAPRLYVEWRA